VARRRGTLNGKAVYHVNYYPYRPEDRIILIGKPPEGIRPASGKGSVRRSATLISGIPPAKPIRSDTGAVDDIITSEGKGINVISVQDTEARKPKLRITLKSDNDKAKTGSRYNYRVNPRRHGNMPLAARDLGGGIEQTRKGRHLRLQ